VAVPVLCQGDEARHPGSPSVTTLTCADEVFGTRSVGLQLVVDGPRVRFQPLLHAVGVPFYTFASDCLQLLDDRDGVILVPDDEDMPILVRELPGRVS
jgi:hypothetical protein